MRAEMTVGLDLTSLENLKIFNGHEEVKKEPRRQIDSSPEIRPVDIDSDDQQQQLQQANKKGRQKYGRPANPIPRHKRDSHIKAEYKRRDKIQKGFDSLVSLVPELRDTNANKESKSSMLFKAAEYCRRLKGETGNMQSEMEALRQELEALGTEIHDLQGKLPQQGLDVAEKDPVKMDVLYDKYIAEETKKNWKFWIFGFFMGPLYQSYRQAMSSVTTRQEFTSSIGEWMQETLSLTNLRKGFFEALRKISIQTGIMTEPEILEEEAKRCAYIHNIKALPDKPTTASNTTPDRLNPSPSQRYDPKPASLSTNRKPKSQSTTPEPSPVIPRRPVTQIRSIKRESRKSKESRSRSITPPAEETKQKRRSSHHRTDRRGDQEGYHSGRSSRAHSPRTYNVDQTFNKPFLNQTSPQPVSPVTFSPTGPKATFSPAEPQTAFTSAGAKATFSPTGTRTAFTPARTQTTFVPLLIPQNKMNMSQSEVVSTLRSLLQECSPSFKTLETNPSIIIPKIVPATHPNVQPMFHPINFPISQSNVSVEGSSSLVSMDTQSSTVDSSCSAIPEQSTSSGYMCMPRQCESSSFRTVPQQPSNSSSRTVPIQSESSSFRTLPQQSISCSYRTVPQQTFTPISQSSIITNTGLMPLDNHSISESLSIENQPTLSDVYTSVTMPDLQSLLSDNPMPFQTTTSLDQLTATVFTTAQPTVMSTPSTINLPVQSHVEPMSVHTEADKSAEAAHFLHHDEDSMMKMLSVDVMDINSVMTFFDNDQSAPMVTDQSNKSS